MRNAIRLAAFAFAVLSCIAQTLAVMHMFAALPPTAEDRSAITYYAPALLAHGITGVRSMFDDLGAMRKLREELPGFVNTNVPNAGLMRGYEMPVVGSPKCIWPLGKINGTGGL